MPAERQVRFLAPARAELIAAIARYEEEREGLGDAFLEHVARAIAVIAAAPERWPPARRVSAHRRARRYVLQRFPYGIIYRQLPDGVVEIVAVAHHKRRPGYWGRR